MSSRPIRPCLTTKPTFPELDIYSANYFTSEQERLVKSSAEVCGLVLINMLNWKPDLGIEARPVIDFIEGWIPTTAGEGYITLSVQKLGDLEVFVSKDSLRIDVRPYLPFGLWAESHRVLETTERVAVSSQQEKQDFAFEILQQAKEKNTRWCTSVSLSAGWQWGREYYPSPEWIALRTAAKAKGTLPPRAIHWLADQP